MGKAKKQFAQKLPSNPEWRAISKIWTGEHLHVKNFHIQFRNQIATQLNGLLCLRTLFALYGESSNNIVFILTIYVYGNCYLILSYHNIILCN